MFALFVKVNHIERGINPPSVHKIHFTGSYVATGFRIGAIAGMIGLTVSQKPRLENLISV